MLKLGLIFFFFSTILLLIINLEVKSPYMDEIFHFPQASKYYRGVFAEWDPKITTPPGLYLSTLCVLLPLSGLTGVDLNKVQSFRMINLLFSVGNFYLFFKILFKYHEGHTVKVYALSALNLAMFPVLYFFTFLYYTDCGSTFFVLLMYYLHLRNCFLRAAIAGAVSLLFRQTNIVWVFYVAAYKTLDHVHSFVQNEQKNSSVPVTAKQNELYRMNKTFVHSFVQNEQNDNENELYNKLNQSLWEKDWKNLLFTMLEINMGYILVALCFLTFVIKNGSVALGDKEAHQVCFNVPQILYFSLFFLLCSCPYLISPKKAKDFLCFIYIHKIRVIETCLLCAYIIMHFSYVHPYLLADNRHYTFYIWRRILSRNMNLSLALIPIYIYSFWSVYTELEYKRKCECNICNRCNIEYIFKYLLAFCIFVTIVPQKLLEFRYFIIPYIMLRIQFKYKSLWLQYFEFVLYTVINYITLYLFLHRTFTFENSADIQRFMW